MRMYRSRVITTVALVAALLLGIQLQGCAGSIARDTVGVPALLLSDDGIRDDALRGIATLPEADRTVATARLEAFHAAIESKIREAIAEDALPRWADVRSYAQAGIASALADGSIGPGVAKSLTERLDRFGEVLGKTAGPDP